VLGSGTSSASFAVTFSGPENREKSRTWQSAFLNFSLIDCDMDAELRI